MREYSIVSPRFWIGNTGRTLRSDKDGQVLAMYLMTGPHASMTGLYYCPVTYMAQETGLTVQGALKALHRLINLDFCSYDDACEWVFVHTMVLWQVGRTVKPADRRLVKIQRDFEMVPSIKLRSLFIARHSKEIPLSITPSDQDQDQDQDQDHRGLQAPSMPLQNDRRNTTQGQEPEMFTAAWRTYPKRSGSNPRKPAMNAWASRIREGRTTPEDALDAVQRYRDWCQVTNKIGTETVMQFASFFGPQKEGYLQDWTPPQAKLSSFGQQKTFAQLKSDRTDQALANVLKRKAEQCSINVQLNSALLSETSQNGEE